MIAKNDIYKHLIISKSLSEKLGYKKNSNITHIRLGERSIKTTFIRLKHNDPQLILPSSLANRLSLPYSGAIIRVIYDGQNLRLGPIIGILTTGCIGEKNKPFGGRTSFFSRFMEAGRAECPFFFVFTPDMINWNQRLINGWYFRKLQKGENRWFKHTSPFPDVIYERVPNRRSENLHNVKICLERFKQNKNCQIFNQGFFNKWDIHCILKENQKTVKFIPETHSAPSMDTMEEMLKNYNNIYLKPIHGSLGLGIIRITKPDKGAYLCRFHNKKTILHRFKKLSQLLEYHFQKNPNRFRNYLAQQGINLIRYEDRPVDFRVHMHKDRSSQWQVIAIGCKVAGPGSITTHVRTGGKIASTQEVLKLVFDQKVDQIKTDMAKTAIETADALTSKIIGPIGELGIDMGVDTNGDIWLFEINAKPGRHIFHHPSLKTAGKKSAKCITDYSLHLANFI